MGFLKKEPHKEADVTPHPKPHAPKTEPLHANVDKVNALIEAGALSKTDLAAALDEPEKIDAAYAIATSPHVCEVDGSLLVGDRCAVCGTLAK